MCVYAYIDVYVMCITVFTYFIPSCVQLQPPPLEKRLCSHWFLLKSIKNKYKCSKMRMVAINQCNVEVPHFSSWTLAWRATVLMKVQYVCETISVQWRNCLFVVFPSQTASQCTALRSSDKRGISKWTIQIRFFVCVSLSACVSLRSTNPSGGPQSII